MSESDTQRIAREAGVPADHPWLAGCGCWTCTTARVEEAAATDGTAPWYARLMVPMCVCGDCGNKRCPRATNHELSCSGSNEPGQVGSRYAPSPASPAQPNADTEEKSDGK